MTHGDMRRLTLQMPFQQCQHALHHAAAGTGNGGNMHLPLIGHMQDGGQAQGRAGQGGKGRAHPHAINNYKSVRRIFEVDPAPPPPPQPPRKN